MKSEIQKLNEDRTDTERVEQSMAILISVGLFVLTWVLTILAMGYFIEYLVLPRLNP